jgi:hypothetical protein
VSRKRNNQENTSSCSVNLVYTNFYYASNQISQDDTDFNESGTEKKIQTVSDIQSTNKANEIVKDAEQKEEER